MSETTARACIVVALLILLGLVVSCGGVPIASPLPACVESVDLVGGNCGYQRDGVDVAACERSGVPVGGCFWEAWRVECVERCNTP